MAPSNRITLSFIFATLLHTHVAAGDLPVHCPKWQVLGTWEIKVNVPVDERTGASCGHPSPDTARAMFDKHDTWEHPAAFNGVDESKVRHWTLHIEDEFGFKAKLCRGANRACEKVSWSMVYDQGMLLTIGNGEYMYFTFRFMPKSGGQEGIFPDERKLDQFNSFCGSSLSGWWVKRLPNSFEVSQGCVIARNTLVHSPHSSGAFIDCLFLFLLLLQTHGSYSPNVAKTFSSVPNLFSGIRNLFVKVQNLFTVTRAIDHYTRLLCSVQHAKY
jgi:hypothetical protein